MSTATLTDDQVAQVLARTARDAGLTDGQGSVTGDVGSAAVGLVTLAVAVTLTSAVLWSAFSLTQTVSALELVMMAAGR